MNQRQLTLSFILAGVAMLNAAVAQQPELPRTTIQWGRVTLEQDKSLQVQHQVFVPETMEQTYTVKVPYTETRTRTVDDKVEEYTVTLYRLEQRTRTVQVMRAMAETMQVADGNYAFYRMGGGKISTIGSGPKPAVIVMPNQKLDTWYRSLLRDDALVVVLKEPKASEPPETPPTEVPAADDTIPSVPVPGA